MRALTLQEKRQYRKEDLPVGLAGKLLGTGILKAGAEGERGYACSFVGVAVTGDTLVLCYPGYLSEEKLTLSCLKKVLLVLRKSRQREQRMEAWSGSDGSSVDRLSVLLFLIEDYFGNGCYRKEQAVREENGNGEIIWDRTVNSVMALIDGGIPYYPSLITRKRSEDSADYFKNLHALIVTEASDEIQRAGLGFLFGLPPLRVSEETLEDFGETEYILYRLEMELSLEFNTRKQLVLEAMIAFLSSGKGLQDKDSISAFGTTSFYHVWETACAWALGSQLQEKLSGLALPLPLGAGYDKDRRLIDLIEKPYWEYAGRTADDTLIPDIIRIEGKAFLIFDAKYYTPRLEYGKAPQGQPGIESITKEYLYQLAYQDFIKKHGFTTVRNCFLLPSDGDSVIDKGTVSLPMLEKLSLEPIEVRMVPASRVYDCYLSGKKLMIEELGLQA